MWAGWFMQLRSLPITDGLGDRRLGDGGGFGRTMPRRFPEIGAQLMAFDTEDARHGWNALRRHLLPPAHRTGLDAERAGDLDHQAAAAHAKLRR